MAIKDKKASEIIAKHSLNNQKSTSLVDDSYLVEKTNTDVSLMYRTKPGEKCTQVTSDTQEIPKGAQSFTFAVCRVFKTGYESTMRLMVPEMYLNASTKAIFAISVVDGFATFKDRPLTETQVNEYLSDEVEA